MQERPEFSLFGLSIFLTSIAKSLAHFDNTEPKYRTPQWFLVLLDVEIVEQEVEQELTPEENHTLRLLHGTLVDSIHLQLARNEDRKLDSVDWQRLASEDDDQWRVDSNWLLPE